MPRREPERWLPTDHACRECGGRIVQVTNAGPTGGGNPVYRCADCGFASSDHGPHCVCWCGQRHKGQSESTHRCVRVDRAKEDPVMLAALTHAGYLGADPSRRPRVEIAVVSEDLIRIVSEKIEAAR